MTLYAVYDRPGDPAPAVVAEKFSWLAFLLPPVFTLVHGLWLSFFAVVSVTLLVILAGAVIGPDAASLVYIALALLFGFEAPALRGAALRRRGFGHAADIVASGPDLAAVTWLEQKGAP